MTKSIPKLLSKKQTAAMLGISLPAVDKWNSPTRPELKPLKLGINGKRTVRFYEKNVLELQEWLQSKYAPYTRDQLLSVKETAKLLNQTLSTLYNRMKIKRKMKTDRIDLNLYPIKCRAGMFYVKTEVQTYMQEYDDYITVDEASTFFGSDAFFKKYIRQNCQVYNRLRRVCVKKTDFDILKSRGIPTPGSLSGTQSTLLSAVEVGLLLELPPNEVKAKLEAENIHPVGHNGQWPLFESRSIYNYLDPHSTLLSDAEVLEVLGINKVTLYKWRRQLPQVFQYVYRGRTPYFKWEPIDQWLKNSH